MCLQVVARFGSVSKAESPELVREIKNFPFGLYQYERRLELHLKKLAHMRCLGVSSESTLPSA